jgi:hypothetical protein
LQEELLWQEKNAVVEVAIIFCDGRIHISDMQPTDAKLLSTCF